MSLQLRISTSSSSPSTRTGALWSFTVGVMWFRIDKTIYYCRRCFLEFHVHGVPDHSPDTESFRTGDVSRSQCPCLRPCRCVGFCPLFFSGTERYCQRQASNDEACASHDLCDALVRNGRRTLQGGRRGCAFLHRAHLWSMLNLTFFGM